MLAEETFLTSDRYLAAYLLAHRLPLQGLGSDGRFTSFIFLRDPALTLVERFESNGAIGIQAFIAGLDEVQSLIRRREQGGR